jgi:hypothetical protein
MACAHKAGRPSARFVRSIGGIAQNAHIKFLISNMIFSTKLTSGEPGQATGLGGPNGWKPCRCPPLNEARSIAARLLGAAY